MAMIGRNAAVAEVGRRRHEIHGTPAFLMWLGVHATLMTGVRPRIDAFLDWAWDYFSDGRASQPLNRTNSPRIDWRGEAYEPTTTGESPLGPFSWDAPIGVVDDANLREPREAASPDAPRPLDE